MKRSLTIKWCLMILVCMCLFTPALAMAQWGSSYYSDYYSYSEDYYSSGGNCGCSDSGGWADYIPYLGSCNKIEIDDRIKIGG